MQSATLAKFDYRTLDKIPATVAREIEGTGLTRDDIRMIIPDRTLDRRIAQNEPLKVEEADGLARLLRVLAHAMRVFDDREDLAQMWMRLPNPAMSDGIPIQLARTDLGAREVETILGRMEHGVFS